VYAESMQNLMLRLLGPTQISANGMALVFPYEKVQALLIYLAVEAHHAHRRSALAGLFWPDQPEVAARHNLTQALWSLRRVLGNDQGNSLLRTTRETVEFSPNATCYVDLAEFNRQLASGAPQQLEQAVSLYRGDFLESLALEGGIAFEEWAQLTRERLHRRVCTALEQLTEPLRLAAEPGKTLDFARRWVEIEPLNEEAQRRLMRSLADTGQRTAALVQYEHCRQLLQGELGVEPEAETVALYDALKQSAPLRPALSMPQLHLPLPPNRLIGRDDDLDALAAALAEPATRLLTIIGPGGVGKTRLALQIAINNAHSFADGVCFVQLAALREPSQAPAALAQALELPADETRSLAEQIQRALAPRNTLLLIDNCEHLLPDLATLVAQLLAAAPRLVILATSRSPLHLSNEQRYPLAPLALPDDEQSAAQQFDTPAMALFVERARTVNRALTLDATVIGAICRALDGLPLALELAATRTRLLSPAELLTRLEHRLPLLSGGPRDLPARQQTLFATIDWSYQLLDPGQQALFRRLATFVGGWTVGAAEAISADLRDESGSTVSILDELGALLDASLIVEMPTANGEPRCTMLETINAFAHEQLVAHKELAHARALHARTVALFAAEASVGLAGAGQRTWFQRGDQERENVWAALTWCAEHAVGMGLKLAADLGRYWHVRGHSRAGRDWLERLLEQAQAPDLPRVTRDEYAYGLLVSGMLASFLSELDLASTRIEASEALYAALGNEEKLAATLNIHGIIAMQRRNYPLAEQFFKRSLALRRRTNQNAAIASSLSNLGAVTMMQGDGQTAHSYYEQSLALYQQVGDRANTALVMTRMATLLLEQQDFAEAQRHYEASHAIALELGNMSGIWQALHGLGTLWRVKKHYDEATSYFRQSIAISHEIQYLSGLVIDLFELGQIAWETGQAERATMLLAAVAALMQRSQIALHPADQLELERYLHLVRTVPEASGYEAAWAYGQTLSLEQITTIARDTP
jgi:predicted ATPase/DNA-binding SARP family transcriptional activator